MTVYVVLAGCECVFASCDLSVAAAWVRDNFAANLDDCPDATLLRDGTIQRVALATPRRENPAAIFKPWIVVRPDGGCQVLFPLTKLDGLIEEVLEANDEPTETA